MDRIRPSITSVLGDGALGDGIAAVQDLWREYWAWLALPPEFQGFAEEMRTLPGVYAPPQGRLWIARMQDEVAGTAALRPLRERWCEIKRLYVRPAFRGRGLGQALLSKAIEEAREEGYARIFCDTLPWMTVALRLYKQAGFAEVAAYSATPTPGAVFLGRDLSIRDSDGSRI